MKHKIIYGLNLLWASFVAFSFPFCLAWIFLDITGHSKGYDYDLGPEKDISIMIGCVELLIWLVLALPSNIYVIIKTAKKNRLLLIPLLSLYLVLAWLCVMLIGGWWVYLEAFGY